MPTATLRDFHQLKPEKYEGKAEIRGTHCCLWTERVPTLEHALYQSFPRAMASAEVGWSQPARMSYDNFVQRVKAQADAYAKRSGYSLDRTKENQQALNQLYPKS